MGKKNKIKNPKIVIDVNEDNIYDEFELDEDDIIVDKIKKKNKRKFDEESEERFIKGEH